ncbi:hypothetical protein POM88_039945 [Heracleum sosnowskyi]|uniref:Ubiquitin-like protease family profile domain-containing protein n=1 Tax=Heracleum sosnowskyi TaxID=360622 RepID=A0AAD8M9B4_9APIA|nr:hypothetical protein POM88_039945 [Heracleum sosnowskyi]
MDICKDINKEHGESQPKAQADDDKMGTPAPAHDDKMGTPAPLEQEIRGKRKLRPAAAYRSPYVRMIVPLDETRSEDEQYKIYVTEMNHFLQKHPNTKFKDYDLIFFPILAYEHFYLISLNIKARTWEVIDNIRHVKAANNVYTAKLHRLKKHFAKYLKEKEQSWFASSIIRMKTIYLTMPCQTLQNNTDCGVFLMRHMETYKGDKKKWDTQFKEEGQLGQREQLVRLRIKYTDAMLTSHINEKRNFVIRESNFLYKKLAGKGLLKAIVESSKKKTK